MYMKEESDLASEQRDIVHHHVIISGIGIRGVWQAEIRYHYLGNDSWEHSTGNLNGGRCPRHTHRSKGAAVFAYVDKGQMAVNYLTRKKDARLITRPGKGEKQLG